MKTSYYLVLSSAGAVLRAEAWDPSQTPVPAAGEVYYSTTAPAYSGMPAPLPGQLMMATVTDGTPSFYFEDARTLAEAKAAKKQELAAAWKADLASGIPVGGGKSVPSDAESMTDYLLLRIAAGEGSWVDQPIQRTDGVFVLLTAADTQALWNQIKSRRKALVDKLEGLAGDVAAATTIAEVDAITWG